MNKIRNIHTIVVGSWRVQSPSKARVKDWDKKEGKDCYAEEMGMFVTSHNIEYLNFHVLQSLFRIPALLRGYFQAVFLIGFAVAHSGFSCFSGERCLACSEVRDCPVFLFVKENILFKPLPKPCHVQGRSVRTGAHLIDF